MWLWWNKWRSRREKTGGRWNPRIQSQQRDKWNKKTGKASRIVEKWRGNWKVERWKWIESWKLKQKEHRELRNNENPELSSKDAKDYV